MSAPTVHIVDGLTLEAVPDGNYLRVFEYVRGKPTSPDGRRISIHAHLPLGSGGILTVSGWHGDRYECVPVTLSAEQWDQLIEAAKACAYPEQQDPNDDPGPEPDAMLPHGRDKEY